MGARIVIDPEVCGGRVARSSSGRECGSATYVLGALASPVSVEALLGDFPYLAREDINACLASGTPAVDQSVVQAA